MQAYPDVFAVVDTETTGMKPGFARIMDIGILRVEHGEVVETYQTLLNPGMSVPAFISGFTGIRDSDVEAAPIFEEVAAVIERLLTGAVFIAHNASFDYAFLKAEFARMGLEWSSETLCTVKLSRALFPNQRSHSLDSIVERHGISMSDRHRALPDAEAVLQFMRRLDSMFDQASLVRAVRSVRKDPIGTVTRGSYSYVYEDIDDVPRQ